MFEQLLLLKPGLAPLALPTPPTDEVTHAVSNLPATTQTTTRVPTAWASPAASLAGR